MFKRFKTTFTLVYFSLSLYYLSLGLLFLFVCVLWNSISTEKALGGQICAISSQGLSCWWREEWAPKLFKEEIQISYQEVLCCIISTTIPTHQSLSYVAIIADVIPMFLSILFFAWYKTSLYILLFYILAFPLFM